MNFSQFWVFPPTSLLKNHKESRGCEVLRCHLWLLPLLNLSIFLFPFGTYPTSVFPPDSWTFDLYGYQVFGIYLLTMGSYKT